jgi:nitrite reductase/ring-hydroxylating ferredoxin subunit
MPDHSTTIKLDGATKLVLGESRTFPLPDSEEQGFLIRTPIGLRAFQNRCRHWPAPLDMDDGEFWNGEIGMIQCKIHGALYRPEDGLCVYGPCSGHPLIGFPIREEADDVFVDIPNGR